jgi:hypothetical protein
MRTIDIPTERTTAVTDAVLALLALGGALYLREMGHASPWKAALWSWAFGFLALTAALGALAHGFQMSRTLNQWLWRPLNLASGLMIALFVVGVICDLRGLAQAQQALPIAIGVGVVFFGTTLGTDDFRIFIVYEAVAMLFALGAYGWLAIMGRLPGAAWMAGGVLLTIIAAVVQASWKGQDDPLMFIWPFDQNGVYHLVQMAGVVLLLAGLRAALLPSG